MLYTPSHSKFEIPHSRSTSLGSSWLIWMSKIMTWLLAKQETKENISVLFWGSAKFKFNFSQDFVKISINLFNKILKFYWIQQFLLKTFSSWRSCFKILLSKVVNLDIGWFSWHVLSTVHVLPSLYTLVLSTVHVLTKKSCQILFCWREQIVQDVAMAVAGNGWSKVYFLWWRWKKHKKRTSEPPIPVLYLRSSRFWNYWKGGDRDILHLF